VVLTIVAVSSVAVPPVARIVDSLGGYGPAVYEPKDGAREARPRHRPVAGMAGISRDVAIGVALFLLVVRVWLAVVPSRAARPRPRPR
jgi:hypothetical protein